MKVVILCGGLGTRLREETEYRPKPMVPVGGRPILWHIMKIYAHHGHNEFILCLGYKGEIIKDFFRNYHWNTSDVTLKLGRTPEIQYHTQHGEEDWTVTLLDTGQETQTGGRLHRAMRYIADDNFLLTYGDGVSDVDISAAIGFHRGHGGVATVTAVHPPGRFGDMQLDGSAVRTFHEKPESQTAPINGGFFVLNKSVGAYLGGDDCVFETDVLPKLAAQGEFHAFDHPGFWQCMDTYRELALLDQLWNSGKAPWKIW